MKQFAVMVITCMCLVSFQTKVMTVRQGEVFKVVLKANHSTGYNWQWEKKTDDSIIDSVYVDYVLSNKMMTGAGGNEIWEFKAKRKGEQKLIMLYKRPWEKNGVSEKREIFIKVE